MAGATIIVAALGAVTLVSSVRFTQALRPGWLIASMAGVFGLFAPLAWEWGRGSTLGWSGVPSSVILSSEQVLLGRSVFLAVSLGALLGLLVLRVLPGSRRPRWFGSGAEFPSIRVTGPQLGAANLALAVLWLAGQGPSVWLRMEYLQADGQPTLLRLSSGIAFPALVAQAIMVGDARLPNTTRRIAWVASMLWVLALVSVGSRLAIVIVLGLAVAYGVSRRRHPLQVGFAAAVALFGLSWIARALHSARGQAHGLVLLPHQFSDTATDALVPAGLLDSLRGLAASFSALFPQTVLSASDRLPADIAWAMMNPVPQLFLTQNVGALELAYGRLLPWTWVPKSAMGMGSAAFGLLGVVIFYAVVTLLLELLGRNGGNSTRLLLLGFALIITGTSAQYGIRQFSRLTSLLLVVLIPLAWSRLRRADPGKGPTRWSTHNSCYGVGVHAIRDPT